MPQMPGPGRLEQFLARTPSVPRQQTLRRREALSAVDTEVKAALRSVMPSSVTVITYVPEFNPITGRMQEREGIVGAGFVIKSSEDEIIIATNKHVVEPSIEKPLLSMKVQSSAVAPDMTDRDNQLFTDPEVVYVSEDADIAFIRIDPKQHSDVVLPEVTLGSSTGLQAGHSIGLIGAPRGSTFTTSVGRIAHDKYIELDIDGRRNIFIQIDASMRPGNSGGVAIDLQTDPSVVIGMPTAGVEGDVATGFMIPVEIVEQEWEKYQSQKTKDVSATTSRRDVDRQEEPEMEPASSFAV